MGVGGSELRAFTEDGLHVVFPAGGLGGLLTNLAVPLRAVHLGRTVEEIDYEAVGTGGGEPLVRLVARRDNGAREAYTARFAVVTLPLGVLAAGRVAFAPPLPRRKLDAIARLGVARMEKVLLRFSTAFWPSTSGWPPLPFALPGPPAGLPARPAARVTPPLWRRRRDGAHRCDVCG